MSISECIEKIAEIVRIRPEVKLFMCHHAIRFKVSDQVVCPLMLLLYHEKGKLLSSTNFWSDAAGLLGISWADAERLVAAADNAVVPDLDTTALRKKLEVAAGVTQPT